MDYKVEDQKTKCFICSIKSELLDKSSDKGFEYHIKFEHYMWNYLFYKYYLDWKNPTEYNGIESYIKENLNRNDIQWFPIEKYIFINIIKNLLIEQYALLKKIKKKIKKKYNTFQTLESRFIINLYIFLCIYYLAIKLIPKSYEARKKSRIN